MTPGGNNTDLPLGKIRGCRELGKVEADNRSGSRCLYTEVETDSKAKVARSMRALVVAAALRPARSPVREET